MEEHHQYIQNSSSQDANHEDEAIFDTLSLSDLMIYDNNGDPHELYRLNDQNDDDDEFEFSSELLKTSITTSVVFCGKIIPYKESIVSSNTHKLESKRSHKQRWKFVRVFKKSSKSKSNIYSEKLDLKYDVPIRRVSILASATKPRWYLLLFGFGSSSFSAQMHISDLKKRQTTKDRKDDKKRGGSHDGGVGSWSLMRFLGCGGGDGGGGCSHGGDNHHRSAIKKLE